MTLKVNSSNSQTAIEFASPSPIKRERSISFSSAFFMDESRGTPITPRTIPTFLNRAIQILCREIENIDGTDTKKTISNLLETLSQEPDLDETTKGLIHEIQTDFNSSKTFNKKNIETLIEDLSSLEKILLRERTPTPHAFCYSPYPTLIFVGKLDYSDDSISITSDEANEKRARLKQEIEKVREMQLRYINPPPGNAFSKKEKKKAKRELQRLGEELKT